MQIKVMRDLGRDPFLFKAREAMVIEIGRRFLVSDSRAAFTWQCISQGYFGRIDGRKPVFAS